MSDLTYTAPPVRALTITDGLITYNVAPDPAPAPVCFIAGGNMTNAGARLRAYWPARFIPGAAVCTWAESPPPARAYVFQKLVDLPLLRRLSAGGAACFWDVCDPAWWFNPKDVDEIVPHLTAAVASNEGLAEDLYNWAGGRLPVRIIPDRLLLEHYNRQAEHGDRRPVRLIWFGSAQNRMALYAAHANLQRLTAEGYDIALTICDNAPNAPFADIEGVYPVYYTRWQLETEAATLAAHDVALLPPYPGPWGRVKSNNKTLSAWACGLPVVTGEDYKALRAVVTDDALRREMGRDARRHVVMGWPVEQSAADWSDLLEHYTAPAPVAMEAMNV